MAAHGASGETPLTALTQGGLGPWVPAPPPHPGPRRAAATQASISQVPQERDPESGCFFPPVGAARSPGSRLALRP